MVKIKINFSEKAFKIINEVKIKNGLKNIGEAIDLMAKQLIDKELNEILNKDEFNNFENL